ncbi:BatA and WFA domain-containing protein [Candidatus Woesearchaeota archaeon]|nr:BatA and WFA domain-containing protein [Candidatus Woesearchaeota archaeon]
MAGFSVGNIAGLWALLTLVPLIILYLIRPRPTTMSIPSLMFFIQSSGSRKLTSFLKQITRDWLFLIQLLLLASVALTFAHPYSTYQYDITSSNTVIVLDVSASSQAIDGGRMRFNQEITQAKRLLGSTNTIILAKDVPYIAMQDASADEATSFLGSLEPKDTVSKIGDAMILAGETLKDKGAVIVLSDFINTAGQLPEVAKAVLESKGHAVQLINVVQNKGRNVGIVQVDAGNDQTTVYVKNYDQGLEAVSLKIGGSQVALNIKPLSIETYSFKTPPGVTMVEVQNKDDFAVDNTAYISAPQKGKVKVLLIANNASTFMKNALLASGEFELTMTEPPVIPPGDFDVYVVSGVNPKQVLPGTYEDLRKKAENGATVIVSVQPNSQFIDYKGILPVKIAGKADGGFVSIEQLNRFTKNIDFGKANVVYASEQIGEQAIIASVNNIPVMTIKPLGTGKVVYFGISEENDFKFSPHYPIFWTEFIKFVTEQQDVKNLNFKAGESLLLDEEQTLRTPHQKMVKKAALVLDEVGIYELQDRKIAVNLASDLESDINRVESVGTRSKDYELQPVRETRKFSLETALLALALFLVLFEVFFVKYRGDL